MHVMGNYVSADTTYMSNGDTCHFDGYIVDNFINGNEMCTSGAIGNWTASIVRTKKK